jgi:hypothetical protein
MALEIRWGLDNESSQITRVSDLRKQYDAAAIIEIATAYQLNSAMTLQDLQAHLVTFLSDTMFHYPVSRIRDISSDNNPFSLAIPRANRKAAKIQAYRFNVGIPFPGLRRV